MINLIEELEAATKGSETLDKAIARHLGFRIVATTGGLHIMHQNDDVASWDLPRYSRSIDAALTLVPKGWGWLLEIWQREESWAQVVRRPEGSTKPSGVFEGAEAKTPALALCIAALKARVGDKR